MFFAFAILHGHIQTLNFFQRIWNKKTYVLWKAVANKRRRFRHFAWSNSVAKPAPKNLQIYQGNLLFICESFSIFIFLDDLANLG